MGRNNGNQRLQRLDDLHERQFQMARRRKIEKTKREARVSIYNKEDANGRVTKTPTTRDNPARNG